MRACSLEDCTSTSVAPRDEVHILQISVPINCKTEVSICIKSIGITSRRPLLPPFCLQSHLKLIVTKVCSLFPPRQIKIGSLESFSVVEGGLFSTIGYAGVYVCGLLSHGWLPEGNVLS